MTTAIRVFALLVAVAGLASASFSPATTQNQQRHVSITAASRDSIPAPLPCESIGACEVQPGSSR